MRLFELNSIGVDIKYFQGAPMILCCCCWNIDIFGRRRIILLQLERRWLDEFNMFEAKILYCNFSWLKHEISIEGINRFKKNINNINKVYWKHILICVTQQIFVKFHIILNLKREDNS